MSRPIVLNTRPADQAAELSRLLRDAGFEPLEAPAIEVVPAWRPGELAHVRGRLLAGEYTWLVLSSHNAGRYLASATGLAWSELGDLPILCGQATAQALGITPTLGLAHFSAAVALQALLPQLSAGQRVLVPRAAEGRDELLAGLRAAGVEVDAPVLYRTRPVEQSTLPGLARLMRSGHVSAVTFCSPSAVQGLVQATEAEALRACAVVCLGETTASAAAAAGLPVAGVAQRTSMADLVAAVRLALSEGAFSEGDPSPLVSASTERQPASFTPRHDHSAGGGR